MTTEPIWQTAADLLRREAEALREAHTVRGDWRDDQAAKDDHDRMLTTATELEKWSQLLRYGNTMLEADIKELVELASGIALCLWGKTTPEATEQVKEHATHLLGIYGATTNEDDQVVHPLAEVAYQVLRRAA